MKTLLYSVILTALPILLSAQDKKQPQDTYLYRRLDRIVKLSEQQAQKVVDIIAEMKSGIVASNMSEMTRPKRKAYRAEMLQKYIDQIKPIITDKQMHAYEKRYERRISQRIKRLQKRAKK